MGDSLRDAVYSLIRETRWQPRPDTPEGAALCSILSQAGSLQSALEREEMETRRLRAILDKKGIEY